MDDEIEWDIRRSGKDWIGLEGAAKLKQMPCQLELVHGKLCITEAERRTLLAGLLENIGIDEVVKLGKLEDWRQAIVARGDGEGDLELEISVSDCDHAPDRYWDFRVLEFPANAGVWYEVHEVRYAYGRPEAYVTEPATLGWFSLDGPGGGQRQLARLSGALCKPFLKAHDFEGAGIRASLLEKLGQMIEQSGGARDTAALSAWLDAWLAEPLPELSGATPAQLLHDEDGLRRVEPLLERMRGGLPG